MSKVNKVKMAMLAIQRYPWEQGVCMQALYDLGDMQKRRRLICVKEYLDLLR